MPAPEAPNVVVVAAVAEPPVTVLVSETPVGFVGAVTLPSKALAVRSPASTWKAELAEVKARERLPSGAVMTDARTLAFWKAVAAGLTLQLARSLQILLVSCRQVLI